MGGDFFEKVIKTQPDSNNCECCPDWLRWLGQCCICFSCCSQKFSLKESLEDLEKIYGPVCIHLVLGEHGEVINRSAGDVGGLTAEMKEELKSLCAQKAEEFHKHLGSSLTEKLFSIVSDGSRAPGPNSVLVKTVHDEKEKEEPPTGLPSIYVRHGETSLKIDFTRLAKQLSCVMIWDPTVPYTGPLGPESKEVVELLKRVLAKLPKNSSDLFKKEEEDYIVTQKDLCLILVLCLIAKGHIPVNPKDPKQHPFDPEKKEDPWTETMVALGFNPPTGAKTGEEQEKRKVEGWSTEDQKKLLETARKVSGFYPG